MPGGKNVWYYGLRYHNAKWHIEWEQVGAADTVPWSPRCGFGLATHFRDIEIKVNVTQHKEVG